MIFKCIGIGMLCFGLFITEAYAQPDHKEKNNDMSADAASFKNEIPAHLFDIILSRPTQHSITISIFSSKGLSGYLQYGTDPEKLISISKQIQFNPQHIALIELDSLKENTKYYYRLAYRTEDDRSNMYSDINFFQTSRKAGSIFSFTIQADSHLDENTSTEMYLKTLSNMAADSADFMIDLGDTWMTDKYRENYQSALQQYLAQRFYFGSLCKSSSLFLTLGNHDGESPKAKKSGSNDEMLTWSSRTRNYYYFNPVSNDFYNGNTDKIAGAYPGDYYSWEWGNALFVILDPFRYTSDSRNPWARTLGKKQYDWLMHVLKNSKATFKFVFIHNLVGGIDQKGIARGGVEAAKYFEWGGMGISDKDGFVINRPDWIKPIHELLRDNKVNVIFHGHDHFFAKQDLDKMVYQLVPQPGGTKYKLNDSAKEYGYKDGIILNAPGYLKVTVLEDKFTVDYIMTSIDTTHQNKKVLYSYTIQ